MNYNEAIEYISIKNQLGSCPGLDNIKELLNRLGNPQNDFSVMHIAGTNGKGSIFAFVESVLMEAGLQVGRYISPTIVHYLERFQINTDYILEEEFAQLLSEIKDKVEDMEKDGLPSPTAFEIETALAFLYYKEKQVDIALVECGMGGRLDATNVFDSVICSVISSVSYDHMNFLGDTLEAIAKEKMGIVKKNGLVISYPQCDEVQTVIKSVSKELNATCIFVQKQEASIVDMNLGSTIFMYKNSLYETGILGEHQILNSATAIEIFHAIRDLQWEIGFKCTNQVKEKLRFIEEDTINRGILKAVWPGRYTLIAEKPYFLVDGAHNEEGWMGLSLNNNKYFTNQKFIYIIGVLQDKEYKKMLEILLPSAKMVITVTPDSNRAFSGVLLKDMINDMGTKAIYASSINKSVKIARSEAKEDDVIIACGSLTYIGEILQLI